MAAGVDDLSGHTRRVALTAVAVLVVVRRRQCNNRWYPLVRKCRLFRRFRRVVSRRVGVAAARRTTTQSNGHSWWRLVEERPARGAAACSILAGQTWKSKGWPAGFVGRSAIYEFCVHPLLSAIWLCLVIPAARRA